jgi:hypothetical protein
MEIPAFPWWRYVGQASRGCFTRQPCAAARTYKSSTRQITRQKASGTRQGAAGQTPGFERTTPALSD